MEPAKTTPAEGALAEPRQPKDNRILSPGSKGGAEGQSPTDTGLPPPVFEYDAMPGHKLALVIISSKTEAKNYL